MEKYDPVAIQKEILEFWTENKIPEQIVKFDPKKKGKFYLLDGPPYVNGVPHVGHIKTTTAKDIWSKFKHMQGYSTWWQPGFDCGGLPIEHAVEKKLNIKSKKEILEKVGVDKFVEECKKFAEGNKNIWLDIYKKLGAWRGWVEPYMTYKNYYLESGWWTVKKMWEKGMLVQGEKPVFWCPRCQTTLAGYEVTDSYKEVTDYSVYVKFPILGQSFTYIIIWTTTPWTLPANVAIAVHPDEMYVKVKVRGEYYLLAEKRLKDVFEEVGIEKYEIVEKLKGKDLAGMKYEPVLDIPLQEELRKHPNAHQIILSIPLLKKGVSSKVLSKKAVNKAGPEMEDFVTMDAGSGCVHTAPGHGETDYRIGEHYNLPKVSPVNEEGKLTDKAGHFAGMFVKDADRKIIEYLDERGYLLHFGKIRHSYPLCWRCKTPLIYRLSKQWFFKVDIIKDKMLKENKRVVWLPEFARERFHNWVANAIDWAISVQRFWGIPLPVWVCDSCGHIEVIGSRQELKEKAIETVPKNLDLHKNSVDKIHLKCSECKGQMTRIPDTMNVWFDSGIAPWASLGYPFKNKEIFEKLWPVDMICESQDQIRGWFYSLMFCGVSVFDESPYKGVSMTGWTLDEKGEKMSKSLGNVVYAKDALKEIEADALRFYYCWSVAPWETQLFSLNIAKEIKRVFNVLWNIAVFTKNYSDLKLIDKKINTKELELEDKWIISKINSLIRNVTNDLENFRLHYLGRRLEDFILNDFSRWYIKIIRDRLSPWYSGKDKPSAQFTLLYVLENLIRLLAPVAPFITEKIYRDIFYSNGKPKSVHFLSWPNENKDLVNEELENDMLVAKEVIEAVNSLRQELKIKLRWPVSKVFIKPKNKEAEISMKHTEKILKIMANTESIIFVENIPKKEKREFEFGELCLGKVLEDKAMIRELTRNIQVLRKNEKLKVTEKIELFLEVDWKTRKILEQYSDNLKKGVGAKTLRFEKIKNVKGSLEFKGSDIKIYFEKLTKRQKN
ncbi:MAG: isoleucine--tRNA ligase [Candidatus Aenigmarchaeota archaeon]|nr:isoleucine--tRNA ligase [Candidatus Aenigmarchaeota archaeon]